jgi:coronin-1B/1C/6
MRAYKTVNDTYVEPISFTVPRRAEVFQSDIFPPATGIKPGSTAQEWFDGASNLPPKIDLESVYDGTAPVEVPADYKPPAQAAALSPAKAPAPVKKEPEPTPVVQRAPPPSISEQKGSIAAMASKFQDNERESSDDEASSFEEIHKPVARKPSATFKSEPKPVSPVKSTPPQSTPRATQASTPTPTSTTPATIPTSSGPISAVGNSAPGGSSAVEASLKEIKDLLLSQTKTISAQSEKIAHLTQEVDSLKMRVGSSGSDQSERIRQLELELEEARS